MNPWHVKDWHVYILESLTKDHLSYIGVATEPDRRADEHNNRHKGHKGVGSWFTCFNGPWKMAMHICGFKDTCFRQCESRLKTMSKTS